ncbi:hypothetical protein JL720_1400 [Aureococcus anophagefferens]|nr:hypothetical protein JL720_1400 [Aureococcus anophagefferens]
MAVAATRQFNRLVDDASDPRVLIQDAIHAQVAATPDRVAAEFLGDGRSLTYAALAGEAAALAARLFALGAGGRDALVALQVVKSVEMVAAILGVLDAGAAYLPLDPTWPAARRLFVCDDAACGALVVNGDAADDDEAAAAFESRGRLVALAVGAAAAGRVGAAAAGRVASAPRDSDADRALCYVIYTSGSTGAPKGVMIEHASLRCLMRHAEAPYRRVLGAYESRAPERCAIAFNYVFDAFQQSYFFTLGLYGGTYGPTEATINATRRDVPLGLRGAALRLDSLGRPLPNVPCYVVDPDDGALGAGPYGELWVGGVQAARGYLNRPELTADRFVDDPFLQQVPGAYVGAPRRAYRTGDRVRWLGDGELEFGGRLDFQVKLRGRRIELGEIEHACRDVAGVLDASEAARSSARARRSSRTSTPGRSSPARPPLADAAPTTTPDAAAVVDAACAEMGAWRRERARGWAPGGFLRPDDGRAFVMVCAGGHCATPPASPRPGASRRPSTTTTRAATAAASWACPSPGPRRRARGRRVGPGARPERGARAVVAAPAAWATVVHPTARVHGPRPWAAASTSSPAPSSARARASATSAAGAVAGERAAGDYAFVGGASVVGAGATVGDGAVVGMGAASRREPRRAATVAAARSSAGAVPAGAAAAGVPAAALGAIARTRLD